MPGNDREVFEKLTSSDDTSLEIDYLTYAIFAHEKREWIKHRESLTGHAPSQEEIDAWISNISDYQFRNMGDKAVDFFDEAAREYLADEIAAAKEEALRSAVVSEVKAASAFWKQLAMALATSILAPLLLGGIFAAILAYNNLMPTSDDVLNRLGKSNTPSLQRD